MIRKNKRLYICVLIIFALITQMQGVSIAADSDSSAKGSNSTSQTLKLSLEDAIKLGIANNSNLTSLDISINKMWRVHNKDKSFKEITEMTQSELDEIDEYYKLSEKKNINDNLNHFEEERFEEYRDKYGEAPYYRETFFENYLNGNFSNYSSWLQLLSLKDNYDTSKARLKGDVQALYYNLLYFIELCKYQEDSLETMEKQYSGIELKYEKGLVSELDKCKFELELNKKRMEVQKLNRRKEIQELLFKQLCGIDRLRKIELTDVEAGLNKDNKLDTYQKYLDKALTNRSEIVNAKLQAEVYQKELDYYDKYIKKQYVFARTNLQQQLEDAEFGVTKNILDVTNDIKAAYTDVKSVQKKMEIEKRNAQTKKADYIIAQKKYSLGQISLVDLWKAKDEANSAEMIYKDAQRDTAYSFYRLEELACKLGPGYKASEVIIVLE